MVSRSIPANHRHVLPIHLPRGRSSKWRRGTKKPLSTADGSTVPLQHKSDLRTRGSPTPFEEALDSPTSSARMGRRRRSIKKAGFVRGPLHGKRKRSGYGGNTRTLCTGFCWITKGGFVYHFICFHWNMAAGLCHVGSRLSNLARTLRLGSRAGRGSAASAFSSRFSMAVDVSSYRQELAGAKGEWSEGASIREGNGRDQEG